MCCTINMVWCLFSISVREDRKKSLHPMPVHEAGQGLLRHHTMPTLGSPVTESSIPSAVGVSISIDILARCLLVSTESPTSPDMPTVPIVGFCSVLCACEASNWDSRYSHALASLLWWDYLSNRSIANVPAILKSSPSRLLSFSNFLAANVNSVI